jgi:glycosyltransferase involved in cell wall biosynthesis
MEEKGLQSKGSKFLYRALDILKLKGYDTELLTPETIGHVKHEEMPALYKRCHVIADQFMVGQHGVIALEAIMMNRPVVCYISDKHWEYEEMKSQIVNCTQDPESIADALLKAIDHKVDPKIVERLYNPKKSTEILERTLLSWGFLS